MRRITFELWLRDDYKALASKEICESGSLRSISDSIPARFGEVCVQSVPQLVWEIHSIPTVKRGMAQTI